MADRPPPSKATAENRTLDTQTEGTQADPIIASYDTSDTDTDEEGYSLVSQIKGWRHNERRGDNREFLVKFKKGELEEWLPEKHLDGCVALLTTYCHMNNIAKPAHFEPMLKEFKRWRNDLREVCRVCNEVHKCNYEDCDAVCTARWLAGQRGDDFPMAMEY